MDALIRCSNGIAARRLWHLGFFLWALLSMAGCRHDPSARVVVYCAHDREFAEEILRDFEKQSGLRVDVVYDTEANKSVGLYDTLIREADAPRCDVHWNNEILATIRLQGRGLLQSYASPSALPFPAEFKAGDGTWTAFAARARVILVNTQKVRRADFPKSLWDLTDPRWRGQAAMAKPLFGTTATHAACLFHAWGADKASEFYRKLHGNDVVLVAGNKQVGVDVGAGRYAMGLTDTDDAAAEIAQGRPVELVFPEGETLFIPNTVAMIKGCPNPSGARMLVDYLLTPAVEIQLAKSASKQIPLNPRVQLDSLKLIATPATVRPLAVDFTKAAQDWKDSQEFLAREFGLH
ncbi:MAG: extracellular solute-binding protein [Planctomycetes bacterium]|nr:extracellular solute-binding protein [Planctomycetota bacterium]